MHTYLLKNCSVSYFPFQDSLSLVSGDARNDSDLIDHRISLASSHDFGAGIVTSPRGSLGIFSTLILNPDKHLSRGWVGHCVKCS